MSNSYAARVTAECAPESLQCAPSLHFVSTQTVYTASVLCRYRSRVQPFVSVRIDPRSEVQTLSASRSAELTSAARLSDPQRRAARHERSCCIPSGSNPGIIE